MQKLYEAIYEMRNLDRRWVKDKVNEIFKQFDADRSGGLDRREFLDLCHHENLFALF
jgi:Ca2+-binding EF-hand superfamily protein